MKFITIFKYIGNNKKRCRMKLLKKFDLFSIKDKLYKATCNSYKNSNGIWEIQMIEVNCY